MDYKIVQVIVQSIIDTVQNTAISAVQAIKANTFTTKVENFPDFPKDIKVNNQVSTKKTETLLSSVLQTFKKWKFPTEIKVSNFPKQPDFPKEIKVSNFPVYPKFPEFPKKIEVTNPTDLGYVEEALDNVVASIKGLKLDPKINIEAPKPERVIVPPSNVTVEKTEIDYKKLAQAIADQIPKPDYKKITTLIAEEMASRVVSVGGGGGGGGSFRSTKGESERAILDSLHRIMSVGEDRWGLNNTSKSGSTTYTGEEDVDGNWVVRKIVKTSGNVTMSYAAVKNNPEKTNYQDAWDNKDTLEYGSFKNAFGT